MRLDERLEKALLKSTAAAMGIPIFLLTLTLIHSVVGLEMCEQDICKTPQCLHVADEMLKAMDNTTDPCNDLYQFACGGWMSRQFLTKDQQKVTTFTNDMLIGMITKLFAEQDNLFDHPALTKAKTFYSSCISYTKALAHNKTIIDVVASSLKLWPMNNITWEKEDFNMMQALTKATILGASPLYRIQAGPSNSNDPGMWEPPNKLYFTKPDLAMPLQHYKHLTSSTSYYNIYVNEIMLEAEQFGVVTNQSLADAIDIVNVEIELAEKFNAFTDEDNLPNAPKREVDLAFILLESLIQDLAALGELDGNILTTLKQQDAVIVSKSYFMHKIFNYFSHLPRRTQANYIFWRTLNSLKNVLVEDSRKFRNIIMGASFISTSQMYTEKSCTLYVANVFDLVVYRHLYYDAETIHRILQENDILAKLVSQFEVVVPKHNWLGLEIMNAIIDKARAMELVVAFLEKAMNDEAVESRYSKITANINFIENVLQARKDAIVRDIINVNESKVSKPPSLDLQSAAQYYRNLNKIYITPALFQPPIFLYNVPKSVIYAAYGSIIAREIMQGFNKKGYEYDRDGKQRRLFYNVYFPYYPRTMHCFTSLYNDFVQKANIKHVNFTLFLDSTIVDAFALILAYKAFNASYEQTEQLLPGVNLTSEQIFFVKYAQMRCTVESKQSLEAALDASISPDKFRIIAPLQNSRDFGRAFGCKLEAYMHPSSGCTLQ